MVAPECTSRATMQISSGLSPSDWWNSKSTSQISRKRRRVTLHLPPKPAEHRVIQAVDEVATEGKPEDLRERHLGPLRRRQFCDGSEVGVRADAHVGLDPNPVGLRHLDDVEHRLAPAVRAPVLRRQLHRPEKQRTLTADR